MANSVENVYSTALFQLCDESDRLDEVFEELEAVESIIFAAENEDFRKMLASPLFSALEKTNALKNVFEGRISDLTLDFLCVLTEKGRINFLPAIKTEFSDMYYDKRNILRVEAVTTVPMSRTLSDKLKNKLEQVTGKTIILTEKQDKSILGGIVLKYGTNEIDSSVRTKLDKLKSAIDNVIA